MAAVNAVGGEEQVVERQGEKIEDLLALPIVANDSVLRLCVVVHTVRVVLHKS